MLEFYAGKKEGSLWQIIFSGFLVSSFVKSSVDAENLHGHT